MPSDAIIVGIELQGYPFQFIFTIRLNDEVGIHIELFVLLLGALSPVWTKQKHINIPMMSCMSENYQPPFLLQ